MSIFTAKRIAKRWNIKVKDLSFNTNNSNVRYIVIAVQKECDLIVIIMFISVIALIIRIMTIMLIMLIILFLDSHVVHTNHSYHASHLIKLIVQFIHVNHTDYVHHVPTLVMLILQSMLTRIVFHHSQVSSVLQEYETNTWCFYLILIR